MLTPLRRVAIARKAIKQFIAKNVEEITELACDIYIKDMMESGEKSSEKQPTYGLIRKQIHQEIHFLNNNYIVGGK